MKWSDTKSIYYDDVNLLAQDCAVKSRKDIPKEMSRFIVSPMASIAGKTLLEAAQKIGMSVCVHRFQSPQDQLSMGNQLNFDHPTFFAVGLFQKERIEYLARAGVKDWLIDVANGYLCDDIREIAKMIFEARGEKHLRNLMVGNVHTHSGAADLSRLNYLAKNNIMIRCGIGNGGLCQTKDATGYNRGQISEILDCQTDLGVVVADGGISSSAEACKAFGTGAEYCMLGSFLAKAQEAECWQNNQLGQYGKVYGGASKEQASRLGKDISHSEGAVKYLEPPILSLKELMEEFWSAVASGVSYGGKKTLTDYIGEGTFELKVR